MPSVNELYHSANNSQIAIAVGATLFGFVLYMMAAPDNKKKSKYSPDKQSIELEPGVRTSVFAPDGKLVSYIHEDAKTTHECFMRGMRKSDNGPCLGVKDGSSYKWMSYEEVHTRAKNFGAALLSKGHNTDGESMVGIFAGNCPEWVVAEQACSMYSMVVVPLYDTLGADACEYIINQTSMETVLVDRSSKAEMLLKSASNTPSLKRIIVIDNISNNNLNESKDIEIININDFETHGKNNPVEPKPAKPEDLCTLCYTSGTTGNPKGVMLTHQNLLADISGVLMTSQTDIGPNDTHISYLPLAHMMERAVQCFMFMNGSRIGFFGGDIRKLLDDIELLKPTLFVTVPRLLNRIYDKVMQGVASGGAVKRSIFNFALSRKKSLLSSGTITSSSIWDKLVFSKVQAKLGGQVRFIITGSAPLSAAVMDFARCAFGCHVYEGYGQTECTAAGTMTIPEETESGHVGPPLPCNLIKLIDVPEMDYFVKDQKGEVCFKGTNVMKGYYHDEEKTNETIDKDGWLHSGDVGMWLPNGTLRIIDRRKHIFKLAQGEYLAPEKIENIYIQTPLVAQAFVDGHSLETFAVAVVVPDPETIPEWKAKHGLKDQSMEEICKNKELKKEIHDALIKKGKEAGLKGFEQAKEIHLHPELFTADNGLLTPTFKSKRPALRKFFSEVISDLYAAANGKAA